QELVRLRDLLGLSLEELLELAEAEEARVVLRGHGGGRLPALTGRAGSRPWSRRAGGSGPRGVDVLGGEPVEDPVHPALPVPVGAPADALPDEPGALGVALGALVEAVDLELQAVVAELL